MVLSCHIEKQYCHLQEMKKQYIIQTKISLMEVTKMFYKKERDIFFLIVNNLDMAKVTPTEVEEIMITIMNKGEEARQKAIRELTQMEKDKSMTLQKVWEMIEKL